VKALLATAVGATVLAVLLVTRILAVGNPTLLLVMDLALLGLALPSWLISRESLLYKMWSILLSASVFSALSYASWIPSEVALLSSLLILLGLLLSAPSRSPEPGGRGLLAVAALMIGLAGAVLDVELLPWIILSPVIEVSLAEKRENRSAEVLGSLYAVSVYGLSMGFSYIVLAYMLVLCLARLYTPFLRYLNYAWLDSLARLVLAVALPWM